MAMKEKIGRNDPCFCGSEEKYKKCCINLTEEKWEEESSITIGSVVSPIGNPQNLLIAVKSEMLSPFLNFIVPLILPTLINLVITYFYISFIYRKILTEPIEKPVPGPITHYQTVHLVKLSFLIMLVLIVLKSLTDFIHLPFRINFSHIAIISALPLFLVSRHRWVYLKKLDWGTLIFFASTFILIQSVWNSGFLQDQINDFHFSMSTIPMILIVSIILSQFISNVPLVALYLPLLLKPHMPESHLLALAVGSTIAGNVSMLGAASNIIIAHNAEKRKVKGFGFFEFVKIGLPLTLINVLIYSYFFFDP